MVSLGHQSLCEEVPRLAPSATIGGRLRRERQRREMTVREVARRVGVSPSLISMVERGKVNPSVSTLWGLVTVLGVDMGDLFPDGASSAGSGAVDGLSVDGPVTAPDSRVPINLDGGVRWERLTSRSDPLVEFLAVVYEPGGESCASDSPMRHGGKEYGYVISGRLGVRIDHEEYELEPGMAISFDACAPHRLWAIGDRRAEAIWVVVGRQGESSRLGV